MNYLVVLTIHGAGWDAVHARARADEALRGAGALRADAARDDLWEVPKGIRTQDLVQLLRGILRGADEARFYLPMRKGVLEVFRQQGEGPCG